MKKIVFYVMTALMSTSAFANANDSTCVKYDITLDAESVNTLLGITDIDKAERVSTYCRRFTQDMGYVKRSRENVRPERMVLAVYRNLARMMDVLTREEYHNYLLYINEVLGAKDLAQHFD